MAQSPNTKDKLLDAAESLFAERGFAAASLRAITRRAEANLAAAHYHFGSKDALAKAVLKRHLGPVNRQRLALLEEAEARRDEADYLAHLVRAFVEPVVRYRHDQPQRGIQFAQILSRGLTQPDPTMRGMILDEMSELIRRFMAAFSVALPHLQPKELFWRIHFMVGSMAHTVAGGAMIQEVTGGLCDPTDLEGVVEQLVCFLSAGLSAPGQSVSEENS